MPKSFAFLLVLTLLLSACAEESLPSEVETTPPALGEDEPTESDPMMEIALIALEDDGISGPLVGCGDSIVSVYQEDGTALNSDEKVQDALTALFSIEDQYYGESGLYNALYQSDLSVDSVSVSSEEVQVELSGVLLSGGTCDDPRIQAQIRETILDNAGVPASTPLAITLNGTSLDSLLNGKGE